MSDLTAEDRERLGWIKIHFPDRRVWRRHDYAEFYTMDVVYLLDLVERLTGEPIRHLNPQTMEWETITSDAEGIDAKP